MQKQIKSEKMDAILLAAGVGSRMGMSTPKQFYTINGKPFFIRSLELFEKIDEIENVYLTIHPDFEELYKMHLQAFRITKATLVVGGKSRQESVYLALKKVKSNLVLIHEAARPLISTELVEKLFAHKNEDCVVPTIPIPFTVAIGDDYFEKPLDRSRLHNIQLPQLFQTKLLQQAHKKAVEENYPATEDSMLIHKYGGKVKFVKGSESNIKITTKLDLIIVNQLLKGDF